MTMPSSESIPADVAGMEATEIIELANAYLDLLRLMNEALEACETGYGFFSWSGRGYCITGHPPQELVDIIRTSTEITIDPEGATT